MTNIYKNKDPDYDITSFLLILWQNKRIFIFSILLGVIIGYFYINYKNIGNTQEAQIYSSKIEVLAENIPNVFEKNKFDALIEFEENFYKKENFDSWKKENQNIKIPFEFFNIHAKTESGIFLKEFSTRSVIFEDRTSQLKRLIKIKTDNLNYINEIYGYIQYINKFMTTKYLNDLKYYYHEYINKLKIYKNYESGNINSIKILVDIDYYNFSINNGSKAFIVKKPTFPINENKGVSSKKLNIFKLILFGIFGGLIGILIIIFRLTLFQKK